MSDNVDPVDRLYLPPTHGRVSPPQHADKDSHRKSNSDPDEQFEEELEKKKRHGKVDHVELAMVTPPVQPAAEAEPTAGDDADKQAEVEPPSGPVHVDVKA